VKSEQQLFFTKFSFLSFKKKKKFKNKKSERGFYSKGGKILTAFRPQSRGGMSLRVTG